MVSSGQKFRNHNCAKRVRSDSNHSAPTSQRSHNYVNEITQRTITGGSPVTFQYDGAPGTSNGNLKNDGTLIYSYDSLNRPIQINRVSDGLVIATYLYDAMNRRVRKTITNGGVTGTVPDGTTDYIYMGNQVVEERNSSNAPIRQYVWGTYIDEVIQLTTLATLGAQNVPAGTYYLCQDLLYRAVALTNSIGTVVEAYDCDAYGNTLIFTAPDSSSNWWSDAAVQSDYGANEIVYCGYRYDPETELYYVRNRALSPVLGRWIQRDPIGYSGGINLYEYVMSNPVGNVDPNGTSGCGELLDKINELRQEELKKIAEASRVASELQHRPPPAWYERIYLKMEFAAEIAQATALHNRANLLEDLYRLTCRSKAPPKCPASDTTPGVEPGGAPDGVPIWQDWLPPEVGPEL